MRKTVIVGAGPSGIAAGYYLTKHGKEALLLEKDYIVGGLSKTIRYKGCCFDVGGHRFFTDIPEVSKLWQEVLRKDFLKKERKSRIFYRDRFFNYPLTLKDIFSNLGAAESFLCFYSYLSSKIVPYKGKQSFEDYITSNFGRRLFNIFFKGYTEKVWGIPCSELSCDWAFERIKGLSFFAAFKGALGLKGSVRTLLKEFHYPILGPGMMYEEMARQIEASGNRVQLDKEVVSILHNRKEITSLITKDGAGKIEEHAGNDFISSMPITELIRKLSPTPPAGILEAANRLSYRELVVVNLICANENVFPDNWIYIHSPDVGVARIQNYKNWSHALVSSPHKSTIGLEYFCSVGGEIWKKGDKDMVELAEAELKRLGFDVTVEDGFVYRALNAYPLYSLGYKEYLGIIKDYSSSFKNLLLIGRAGRFQYDNMDGAIASGIAAAEKVLQS